MPLSRAFAFPRLKWALLLACAALALWLGGCAGAGYYWQSAVGHLNVMNAARPVDEWLADPVTPAPLRERLALAARIRAFAVRELHEPDNASYHRYADLHRRAALWNVTAAPPDALTLKTWCYPVIGCAAYRGYYDAQKADQFAAGLREQEGLETYVYGVPAYSTLGWMNWAGGDPLLSTFIDYPAGELARMIFHELAHQIVYVKGDTQFNESFAVTVERLGVARWLALEADDAQRAEYAAFDARRQTFRVLTLQTRRELEAVYARKQPATKEETMQRFRARYAELKARWADEGRPFDGYDRWVAQANNASFGIQAAYDEWTPAFEALFHAQGEDWPRFYAAVRQLAELPQADRDARLRALAE
jgi:predicted aminopeptidase